MNSLLGTLKFLTIIPVSRSGLNEARLCVRPEYFPVVGLLLGIVLATADAVFFRFFPSLLASACTIIALVVLTGGMHLDGLADTADGFFSARPREEILRIMHDSRTGAMGAMAIACILLLKVSALASLAPGIRTQGLLLMPVAGRCAMAALMAYLPPARSDGLAALLQPGESKHLLIVSSAALLVLAWLILGKSGIVAALVCLLALMPLSRYMLRKIGGITGDTLGAACEVVETIVLMTAAGIGLSTGS
jgi:adenosylcobinamide-GDP ribazoletransferase